MEMWQLERRVRRSLHPGTIRCDGWHDDYIRARDGYLLVASVPPNGLGRHVFERLRDSDLWANGGWKRIADQLDEADEIREEKMWEKFSSTVRDESRDVYRFLSLRRGSTVFNSGWAQ